MRLVAKGNNVSLKLEDKMTGALFANCPVETYPGVAIESVTDSSRYFVIRILDDNGNAERWTLNFVLFLTEILNQNKNSLRSQVVVHSLEWVSVIVPIRLI